MKKYEYGLNKKSFEMDFNGGKIWFEHLDSLFTQKDLLYQKFENDLLTIKKPSTSAFISINLDQTKTSKEIIDYILNSLENLEKPIKKVAFTGVDFFIKLYIIKQKRTFETAVINDFQKAKEWLI